MVLLLSPPLRILYSDPCVVKFYVTYHCNPAAIVPIPSQARANGLIGQGDIVISVNGVPVLEPEVLSFAQVIKVIKKYKVSSMTRPSNTPQTHL